MHAAQSVVELLQTLVRIPSVNPTGDPGAPADCVGEEKMALALGEWLGRFAENVELRYALPHRPNVLARFPSDTPGKPRLLFAPHTDTVSVSGMTISPFGGDVRDGRVWGRGSSDTKGSMAAMLWALWSCRDVLPHLTHEIWFAGLAGEEAGQHGSRALAAEERFDFVIVGEPTKMKVVHTHKGSANVQLITRGKSAHASMPELGVNAIVAMASALHFAESVLKPELAAISDPVLGSPTLNIGTIRGGSKSNIVPDFCEAVIDIRLVPSCFQAGFAEHLAARFEDACPGIEVHIRTAPPLFTDPAHPMIQALCAQGTGLGHAPWFCDACIFAEQGMPSVAMGPGSITQAHTADEWLAIQDLEEGTAYFERFLHSLVK